MVAYMLRCATIGRRSTHRVYGQPLDAADVPNHCDGCDGRGTSVAAAVTTWSVSGFVSVGGEGKVSRTFLSRN
jgi:hypothetical protein